jgi:hypothetical protein
MKVNIPLFLHYSRHGHFIRIRKVAIDAIILADGFRNEFITKYLASLVLHDPDSAIRYSCSRSLFNFTLITFNCMTGGLYPESQRKSFLNHLNILSNMFALSSTFYLLILGKQSAKMQWFISPRL